MDMPTTPDDGIPEEATVEPRIVTPEEDARRAERRLAWQERTQARRWPLASDRMRQPGELSPAPEKRH
ncbi:MAG TPA: hypothetical protein VI456_07610 [Polyangia bacterium]